MRIRDYDRNTRAVLRAAALGLLCSVAAGCSSEVDRFADLELVTGATSNQREIIGNATSQPYPGDTLAPQPLAPQPLTSGPVTRSELAPVAAAPASAAAPVRTAALAPAPQPALPQPPVPARSSPATAGWSAAGGTEITLRPGETISSLSRRFGVPVKEILRANGLSDGDTVQAGSRIIVPTFGNSGKAADAGSRVASADPAPIPASLPARTAPEPSREAVLPATPKPREGGPAATAGNRPDQSAATSYKVAAGDTLHAIARRHGVTTEAVKQANGLDNGLIRVGQVLTIPGSGQPQKVAAAPAASKAEPAASQPARKADEIITEARAEAPDSTGVGKMRWPARGRIIGEFGKNAGGRRNDGIDIAVPAGTAIKAAENGVVIYAGDSLKDFGNTVLLRHENGLVTVYGHADKLKVSRGDIVRRGDEIAVAGMTGNADQPKLHFEVRDNSVPVDPMVYLQ